MVWNRLRCFVNETKRAKAASERKNQPKRSILNFFPSSILSFINCLSISREALTAFWILAFHTGKVSHFCGRSWYVWQISFLLEKKLEKVIRVQNSFFQNKNLTAGFNWYYNVFIVQLLFVGHYSAPQRTEFSRLFSLNFSYLRFLDNLFQSHVLFVSR